jgi:hypothetical protein
LTSLAAECTESKGEPDETHPEGKPEEFTFVEKAPVGDQKDIAKPTDPDIAKL